MTPQRAGVLLATAAFLFFAVAMNMQRYDWATWYRLAKAGIETSATVTMREPYNHQTCGYDYVVAGVKYEGRSQGCHHEVGATMRIQYLPDDPSIAVIGSPGEELATEILGAVLLAVVAGLIHGYRLRHQRRGGATT